MNLLSQFVISFSETISFLSLFAAIVGVFVNARIKIAKLEVSVAEIRKDLDTHCNSNDKNYDKIFEEIKEMGKETNIKLEKVYREISELKISLVKNEKQNN